MAGFLDYMEIDVRFTFALPEATNLKEVSCSTTFTSSYSSCRGSLFAGESYSRCLGEEQTTSQSDVGKPT